MARTPRQGTPGGRYPQGTRPTRDIYAIVAYKTDGAPIRVIDRAVDVFRLGGTKADVADRCGIDRSVIGEWLRTGTKVSTDVYGGRLSMGELTRHERKCFEFVQLTAQAEVDGKLYLLGLAEKLAQGGYIIETITERVEPDGTGALKVVERTTKRAAAAPDGPMIRWRLAVGWPDQFRDRSSVAVTGPDGGPIQIDATPTIDRLMGELDRIATNTAEADEMLAAHELAMATAIETTATESEAS